MNQDLAKKWVEALRSGEYEESPFLKANWGDGDKYSALGVLCDVCEEVEFVEGLGSAFRAQFSDGSENALFLVSSFRERIDLAHPFYNRILASESFEEVANLIEEEVLE